MKTKLLKKLRKEAKEHYYVYFKGERYYVCSNFGFEYILKVFSCYSEGQAISYLIDKRREYIYERIKKKVRRIVLSKEEIINKRLENI